VILTIGTTATTTTTTTATTTATATATTTMSSSVFHCWTREKGEANGCERNKMENAQAPFSCAVGVEGIVAWFRA
jgi:hypothetical protein